MTDSFSSPLSRREASARIEGTEWRFLLGALRRRIHTRSLRDALALAAAALDAVGDSYSAHLSADLRPTLVELAIATPDTGGVTEMDVGLARQIDKTIVVSDESAAPGPQRLELAIDAMEIPRVRPFWAAVLGYSDDPADPGPTGGLVDPDGQLPAVWFQQMDAPRTQRNRIHFDLSVAHDAAEQRLAAGIAAGGVLLSDEYAPAFWVLADPEGNEVCVCTWQGRD